MIILKIDTSLLTQVNPIITAIIAIGMVVVAGKFMLKGSIQNAIFSILLCGLLLWAVNDLNGFVNFIKVVVSFIGGVFGG